MANEKVTQLPSVVSAALTDIYYAVQAGLSVQETGSQIFDLMLTNVVLNNAGNPNGLVAGTKYQLLWDTTNNVLYVCTTSGSASTAVWTLGGSVTFPISLTNGGTGASLTANNGGIVYSTASAMAILSGTATARQMLQSGASSAPAWSTATYPATTTINRLFYSSSNNVVNELATANSATLITNSSGVPAWTGSMTNGQVLIGSTGASPVLANLSAGPGVSISNGAGTITISGTGSGIGWTEVTGTSQAMVSDAGYVANNGGLVTFTLPAAAAFGTALSVIGKGAGGWKITTGGGQSIQVGSITAGTSVASTNQFDSIDLICTTANTVWTTVGAPQGTLSLV